MHRVNISLYAAALTVLISGLWWEPYALSAKERPGSSGIPDRKSTRLNSSHIQKSRMPSSA